MLRGKRRQSQVPHCGKRKQGPGIAPVPAWEKIIDSCAGYGRAHVLGYVWTDYGRGGPGSLAPIEAQARAWYTLYPGHIDGIFFDGVSDAVPGIGSSNRYFYRSLAGYVHHSEGMVAQVVLNFGTNPAAGWMFDAAPVLNANVIVTFEGSYNIAGEHPLTTWTPAAWERRYPASDFAALVHNAPDSTALPQPATACRGSGASILVTYMSARHMTSSRPISGRSSVVVDTWETSSTGST